MAEPKVVLGFGTDPDRDAAFAGSDGDGAVDIAAFSTDTIGTTPNDGYLKIVVDGTTYKIPFWEDA